MEKLLITQLVIKFPVKKLMRPTLKVETIKRIRLKEIQNHKTLQR